MDTYIITRCSSRLHIKRCSCLIIDYQLPFAFCQQQLSRYVPARTREIRIIVDSLESLLRPPNNTSVIGAVVRDSFQFPPSSFGAYAVRRFFFLAIRCVAQTPFFIVDRLNAVICLCQDRTVRKKRKIRCC